MSLSRVLPPAGTCGLSILIAISFLPYPAYRWVSAIYAVMGVIAFLGCQAVLKAQATAELERGLEPGRPVFWKRSEVRWTLVSIASTTVALLLLNMAANT